VLGAVLLAATAAYTFLRAPGRPDEPEEDEVVDLDALAGTPIVYAPEGWF